MIGVLKTSHFLSVNVRSISNRHLDNELFEGVTFCFHGRSCFSLFVIVIVVLLLLSPTKKLFCVSAIVDLKKLGREGPNAF